MRHFNQIQSCRINFIISRSPVLDSFPCNNPAFMEQRSEQDSSELLLFPHLSRKSD